MAKPVSERERARIVAAIRAGDQSCGEIAKEFGRSKATISGLAVAEGLTFERSQTKRATEAHQADSAARRAALARRLLDTTAAMLDRLDDPYVVYGFTKDGDFVTGELKQPPAGEARNFVTAAAVALDKHLALERHDSDDQGLAAVDAWLRSVTSPA